jgi:hypothetical protein
MLLPPQSVDQRADQPVYRAHIPRYLLATSMEGQRLRGQEVWSSAVHNCMTAAGWRRAASHRLDSRDLVRDLLNRNVALSRDHRGESMDALDRAWLSLDGLSVGDAFGERFFGPHHEAMQRIARRELPDTPWTYTDDTEMALSVVEILKERGSIDQDLLAKRFAKRMQFQPRLRPRRLCRPLRSERRVRLAPSDPDRLPRHGLFRERCGDACCAARCVLRRPAPSMSFAARHA